MVGKHFTQVCHSRSLNIAQFAVTVGVPIGNTDLLDIGISEGDGTVCRILHDFLELLPIIGKFVS